MKRLVKERRDKPLNRAEKNSLLIWKADVVGFRGTYLN